MDKYTKQNKYRLMSVTRQHHKLLQEDGRALLIKEE